MKLEISLFKFDAQSDYLPYYTKHFVKIKEERTLLDVLKTIHKDEAFGFNPHIDFGVVLNGLYTTLDIELETIKKEFGVELQIEPVNIKRVYKDLLINEDDFNEKFKLLEAFTTQADKALYDSYKLYYYASNTLNVNEEYIGDAIILLAYDLTQKQPENKMAILEVLNSKENGIAFHTSLKNRVFNLPEEIENNIVALQKELNVVSEASAQLLKKGSKNIDFDKPCGTSIIKHTFKEFNIAYYTGNKGCEKTHNILHALDANYLQLQSMNNDVAKEVLHLNEDFTYKLAAEVILDAFDNGADFMVVDNENDFYLFDGKRNELQRVSGREVNLPVIHSNELSKLVCGLHDEAQKTLAQHSINPQLI